MPACYHVEAVVGVRVAAWDSTRGMATYAEEVFVAELFALSGGVFVVMTG
jgi:hypothetical protein